MPLKKGCPEKFKIEDGVNVVLGTQKSKLMEGSFGIVGAATPAGKTTSSHKKSQDSE